MTRTTALPCGAWFRGCVADPPVRRGGRAEAALRGLAVGCSGWLVVRWPSGCGASSSSEVDSASYSDEWELDGDGGCED